MEQKNGADDHHGYYNNYNKASPLANGKGGGGGGGDHQPDDEVLIELGSIDSQRFDHIDVVGAHHHDHASSPPSSSSSVPSSLSAGEMEVLTAICDTFLPSINVEYSFGSGDDDFTSTFYRTSASMAGTPQRVAEMITEKLEHPKLLLMRLTIWLMSTWIGTFILCGIASLSSRFPYFQRFSEVSQNKREEILHQFSLSYLYLLRNFFAGLKLLIHLAYFTQVSVSLPWGAVSFSQL